MLKLVKMNRTENAIRNVKWGTIRKIVSTIGPFLVRTLLIYYIGADYLGLNSLFVSILNVLNLAEMGVSTAITYSMYKPIAEDDIDKICALLRMYKRAYHIIGTIILIIGVFLIPFLPQLIKGTIPSIVNLYVGYIAYLISTVSSYFLFAYKTSLLTAYQREDILSRNMLVADVFRYVLQCWIIVKTHNYCIYVLIIPITTVILNLLNYSSVQNKFPKYAAHGVISLEEKKELKKNILGMMLWKIGYVSRNAFDSIIISVYLGLVEVTIYNNYYYILNALLMFMEIITSSIVAGVGNKIATESVEENYNNFCMMQLAYMWIASVCAVCLLCLYQPFMLMWMGKNLMLSNLNMLLLCIYFYILKQGDMQSVYYQAAGLWWRGKMRSLIEAAINVILNIVLGYFWGITGIIIATIISLLIMAYFYGSTFVFRFYFRNGQLMHYFKKNFQYAIVTGLAGALSMLVCKFIPYGTSIMQQMIGLMLRAVICVVSVSTFFWMFFRKGKDYERMKKIIHWLMDIKLKNRSNV